MDSPTGHPSGRSPSAPSMPLRTPAAPVPAAGSAAGAGWVGSAGVCRAEGSTAGALLGRDPAPVALEPALPRPGTGALGPSAPEPRVAEYPPPPASDEPPRVGLVPTVLQVGVLVLVAYLCLFNFSVVRGSSMAPRIHDGDRILIDHFSYMLSPVERGDIVVLKYPLDPSVDYIKRVIGLPGDRVVLEDGHVFVNGCELEEPYVDDQDVFTDLDVEVLPAHFFVLGDNRRRSCDSREFGQVPAGYVRGKVEVRVWPLGRAGRIDA